MNSITLRKVTTDDLEELQVISRLTFYESFAAENTEADMRDYLENNLGKDRLLKELCHPASDFYFAKRNPQIIGYLKLNWATAQTEFKEKNTLEIERIYVLKNYQGQRVGQLLCGKALEIAKLRHAEFVWLGVWEKNVKAIRFYQKNGFVEFGKHAFRLGSDEQTDLLMRLKLV